MSKVLITKEKIDAIADKVIGLAGVTTNQTLDQLSALLTDINTEVEDQQEIISEISAAVDNLPDAGSQFTTEEKTFTPSTSIQTYTPTSGVYVSKVTVNAMPTGKAATPATTITAAPTISVSSSGLITASASATKSVTPTITSGYVSSGTSGTITVSGSATKQLTTKAATTYTPKTSNQTIAASTYLTGVQTIKGDANLVAGNIKSGVSIFGVTGTYTGGSSSGGGDDDEDGGSSSGAGAETCTVTFISSGPVMPGQTLTVEYINGNFEAKTVNVDITTITTLTDILRNSVVAIEGASSMCTLSGGISKIHYAQNFWAIRVKGPGTFEFTG